jgi:hypothetical protein
LIQTVLIYSPILPNQIEQLSKNDLESLGEDLLDFSTEVDLIAWFANRS